MAEAGTTTGVRDELNVCQLCGALDHLSLCGGCRGTWYCCKDHQRKDWKAHKPSCRKNKTPAKHLVASSPVSIPRQPDMPNETGADEVDSVNADDNSNPASPPKAVIDDSKATLLSYAEQQSYEHMKLCEAAAGPLFEVGDTTAYQTYAVCTSDEIESRISCEEFATNGRKDSEIPQASFTTSTLASGTEDTTNIIQAKSSKKKQKNDPQGNLATISEDGPPPERYYLDYTTHRINLPSSARTTIPGGNRSSAMGQGDKLSPLQSRDQYLSILRSRFLVLAKYVVDCLTRYGICVIDKFLGDVTGREILKEVMQLSEAGVMKQGQLVHGPSSSSNKYIRGDLITWVDGSEARSENIHFLISCMDAVMLQCANKLDMYTINERTKAMVACYPGRRTRYVRHVDNPNGDGRCITCIYYLNENWDVRQHGGLLRIYPEGSDRVANIEPKFDRLLFFWSDRRNPHEVQQSFRERYAITVWYYDAEERAQALKKFKGGSDSNSIKPQAVPLINGNSRGLSE